MSTTEVNEAQADLVTLQDNERVLGNVSFSWWGWWKEILAGLISIPLLGLGLIILYLAYKSKKKSGCVITNQRIVHSIGGLISVETTEVQMKDIRSISTYEGLFAGGVKVDTGAGEIAIGVTNPREMASVIRKQKNKQTS
jgi:hypothetical protein